MYPKICCILINYVGHSHLCSSDIIMLMPTHQSALSDHVFPVIVILITTAVVLLHLTPSSAICCLFAMLPCAWFTGKPERCWPNIQRHLLTSAETKIISRCGKTNVASCQQRCVVDTNIVCRLDWETFMWQCRWCWSVSGWEATTVSACLFLSF